MKNRIALIVIATAVVAASMIGVANAQDPRADHRPCVSTRESHGGNMGRIARSKLERRWEVVGRGRDAIAPIVGAVVAYPWCERKAAGNYIGVIYRHQHLFAVAWIRDDATVYEPTVEPTSDPTTEPTVPPTNPVPTETPTPGGTCAKCPNH